MSFHRKQYCCLCDDDDGDDDGVQSDLVVPCYAYTYYEDVVAGVGVSIMKDLNHDDADPEVILVDLVVEFSPQFD